MNVLTSFGRGSRVYTFPTDGQINYEDDFEKRANKINRLPGMDGGFRSLGTGPGQSTGGTVKAELWLTFDDLADASDKLASLRAMAGWGLQPLWRKPMVGTPQFCWAAFNSGPLRQDVHNVPHQRQRIPLLFDVPDPFWHRTVSGFGSLWGDGVARWGDGVTRWGTANSYTVTNSLTQTFTNDGNMPTFPRLKLKNNSGSSVRKIHFRRMVDGFAEDEFYYDTTLADGTYLDVDTRRQAVRIGPVGSDAFDGFRPLKGPKWVQLMPGSNSLQIDCEGELTLTLSYLERSI